MTSALVCAVIAALSVETPATHNSKQYELTLQWTKELARDGGGEWDLKVLRDGNGKMYGEGPRGEAVDNTGRIFLCDSYRSRLLVFSPDGEREKIILFAEYLHFPEEVKVDENNNVYVVGTIRQTNEAAEVLLKPTSTGWDILTLDFNAYELAPTAERLEARMVKVLPLGAGRSVVMPVKVEGNYRYQIFDEQGKPAGFAPSTDRDREGRYFLGGHGGKVMVFDRTGALALDTQVGHDYVSLVPFRGNIYVRDDDNALLLLGNDGKVKEEIVIMPNQGGEPLNLMASPFADYIYSYRLTDDHTVTFKKWKLKPSDN